jgi:hypothetical protein
MEMITTVHLSGHWRPNVPSLRLRFFFEIMVAHSMVERKYNSSIYSQSFIECQDYNGGPSSTLRWKVYVTLMTDKGSTIVFSDFVFVGSDFAIASESENTATIRI